MEEQLDPCSCCRLQYLPVPEHNIQLYDTEGCVSTLGTAGCSPGAGSKQLLLAHRRVCTCQWLRGVPAPQKHPALSPGSLGIHQHSLRCAELGLGGLYPLTWSSTVHCALSFCPIQSMQHRTGLTATQVKPVLSSQSLSWHVKP